MRAHSYYLITIKIGTYQPSFDSVESPAGTRPEEPRLQADDLWWVDRTTRYTRACERGELFVKIVRENKIPFEERTLARHQPLAFSVSKQREIAS